jgi:hypothetical protein
MSIRDRDYMKRPSGDDGKRGSPSDSEAGEFASRFLKKHPRFLLYMGIGLVALIVIAFIVDKFSNTSR